MSGFPDSLCGLSKFCMHCGWSTHSYAQHCSFVKAHCCLFTAIRARLLTQHMPCCAVLRCAVQAGVTDSPTDSSSSSSKSVASILAEPVAANQGLITGQLDNGLRYVLLGNPSPPQRFEAHLEVHAGSVDEREHEQVRRNCSIAL